MSEGVRNVQLQLTHGTAQLGLQRVVAGSRTVVETGDIADAPEGPEWVGIVATGDEQVGGDLTAAGSRIVHAVHSSGGDDLATGIGSFVNGATVSATDRSTGSDIGIARSRHGRQLVQLILAAQVRALAADIGE